MNRLAQYLILSLILSTPSLVSAAPNADGRGGYGERGQRGGGMMKAIEQLDLTEEQRQEVRAYMQASKEGMRERREQMREAREQFREVMQSDTFDEATIRAAHQKVSQYEEDMAVERARSKSEINQILTAEQQAELKQIREEKREEYSSRKRQRYGRKDR